MCSSLLVQFGTVLYDLLLIGLGSHGNLLSFVEDLPQVVTVLPFVYALVKVKLLNDVIRSFSLCTDVEDDTLAAVEPYVQCI